MIEICASHCTGCGACVDACSFAAISMAANGIAQLDRERCRACGACVAACPTGAITTHESALTVVPPAPLQGPIATAPPIVALGRTSVSHPALWSTLAAVAGVLARDVLPLVVERLLPAAAQADPAGGQQASHLAASGGLGSQRRRRHRRGA
ncbi:MAG: ATP-binding protein [Anaerolineae bacterium]